MHVPSVLRGSRGQCLLNNGALCRMSFHIAVAGATCGLTQADAQRLYVMQVDQWLSFAPALVSGSGLQQAVAALDCYLSLRTFLVCHWVTIADISCWAQLQGE